MQRRTGPALDQGGAVSRQVSAPVSLGNRWPRARRVAWLPPPRRAASGRLHLWAVQSADWFACQWATACSCGLVRKWLSALGAAERKGGKRGRSRAGWPIGTTHGCCPVSSGACVDGRQLGIRMALHPPWLTSPGTVGQVSRSRRGGRQKPGRRGYQKVEPAAVGDTAAGSMAVRNSRPCAAEPLTQASHGTA